LARLAGAHAFLYICQTFNNIGGRPILTHNNAGAFDVAALKDLIHKSLDDDKAQDIQVIELNGQSALADYIVVASGTSSRHITSMAEKLRERLAARGSKDLRVEGMAQANWVVVDAGDVIVHLFRPEVREFYNIEKMWSVSVPGEHTSKSGGLTRV
jgi:ribosome-associated protein